MIEDTLLWETLLAELRRVIVKCIKGKKKETKKFKTLKTHFKINLISLDKCNQKHHSRYVCLKMTKTHKELVDFSINGKEKQQDNLFLNGYEKPQKKSLTNPEGFRECLH